MQRISGILSARNMQIRNSKLCENRVSVDYPPLMDEHAFPPMVFAVAWLGRKLHLVAAVGR